VDFVAEYVGSALLEHGGRAAMLTWGTTAAPTTMSTPPAGIFLFIIHLL
jgi:hypothetical protein